MDVNKHSDAIPEILDSMPDTHGLLQKGATGRAVVGQKDIMTRLSVFLKERGTTAKNRLAQVEGPAD